MTQETTSQATTSGKDHSPVIVEASDLPLHCPSSRAPLWSMHPRVFLDIADTGTAKCPYCGTDYKLAEGVVAHGH